MSSLLLVPTLSALPKSVLFLSGVVLALLLVLLFGRLNRRRYVVVGESEAIRMAIIQLGRIADSLERLNFSPEINTPVKEKEGGMPLSLLGR